MDKILYVLSTHSLCTEGVALSQKNRHWKVFKDWPAEWHSSEFDDGGFTKQENLDVVESWAASIENYLDRHEWKDQSVVFLVPTEDVVSRKLSFPFKERRKIQQVLPFELESELLEDLDEMQYCIDIHTIDAEKSDVLVLLIGKERVERLRRICLERDLVIRSIDCTAYTLYRDLKDEKMLTVDSEESSSLTEDESILFQVYLGADESFMNTIRQGRLNEIRFFPNQLPELIVKTMDEDGLENFLYRFSTDKELDEEDPVNGFESIRKEISWLCEQFTRHLRGRDYTGQSPISIHGIFSPVIEWDGIRFKLRPFPINGSESFSGKTEADTLDHHVMDEGPDKFIENDSDFLGMEEQVQKVEVPGTLDQVMEEASRRNENEQNAATDEELSNPPVVQETRSVTVTQSTLMNLVGRKRWGILGDIKDSLYELHESHHLSLYSDSTPWRRFLHRYRGSMVGVVVFGLLLVSGMVTAHLQRISALEQESRLTEQLLRMEVSQILPEKVIDNVDTVMAELRDKIRKRQEVIKVSKTFEERNYGNLEFLRLISELLDQPDEFRIDQLEYGIERFSMSGSIESYDRLQLLKNGLKQIDEFKEHRLVESNRKSQDGIIFRISIDLK